MCLIYAKSNHADQLLWLALGCVLNITQVHYVIVGHKNLDLESRPSLLSSPHPPPPTLFLTKASLPYVEFHTCREYWG